MTCQPGLPCCGLAQARARMCWWLGDGKGGFSCAVGLPCNQKLFLSRASVNEGSKRTRLFAAVNNVTRVTLAAPAAVRVLLVAHCALLQKGGERGSTGTLAQGNPMLAFAAWYATCRYGEARESRHAGRRTVAAVASRLMRT